MLIMFLISPPCQSRHKNHRDCHIVTSFSILQDITKNITGDACVVTSIVGPNEDAHIFEPKPSTGKLILEADIVIINGLEFEPWLLRLMKAVAYTGPVTVASQDIQCRYMDNLRDHKRPLPDPHAWHTIPNILNYVETIRGQLCQRFPHLAQLFNRNAFDYSQHLQQLEIKFQDLIKNVDMNKRVVITVHDAFGYMGNYYGIKFLSPVGMSTEAEPAAKTVANLIDFIKTSGIKALFIENITNQKIILQIAHETNLSVSGQLYSDALSKDNEPARSYSDLMNHNINTLVEAMQKNNGLSVDFNVKR